MTPFEQLKMQCNNLCEKLLLIDAYCVDTTKVEEITLTLGNDGETMEDLNNWIPELEDMLDDAEFEVQEREEEEAEINGRSYDLEPYGDTFVRRYT